MPRHFFFVILNHSLALKILFRLISVIAGNADAADQQADYDAGHVGLLHDLLDTVNPQYIVGTCSWKAELEKSPALEHRTILMAQVGPPSFYEDHNPYVMGFHINSNEYPHSAVQSLRFHVDKIGRKQKQPVRVLYRNKSAFFNSTCRTGVLDLVESLGFEDVLGIEYDPYADHDDDGDVNEFDIDFLEGIADEVCPPGSGIAGFYPAIFACTIVEQEVLIERWKHNGCRPLAMWMTPSTWGWAVDNPVVPYFQGGGQWHEAFGYSDRYFESGSALLDHNEKEFGYRGTYDIVAGYSMTILFSQHIAAQYRIIDDPTIEEDFASEEGYESLRRNLLVLSADTLFGPFSLDRHQRNNGRSAAASQWLPAESNSEVVRSKCVAPLNQAEAAAIIPAATATECGSGSFVSLDMIATQEALLSSKCESCPEDTFMSNENQAYECVPCVEGSSTNGALKSRTCFAQNPNLLPTSLKVMGAIFVCVTWATSLYFIGWLVIHRQDPVVRISQLHFLVIICVGSILSSSSIIPLMFEADVGEDPVAATRACRAVPFLYTIGWVLEYASLCAKSHRLYQITKQAANLRRVKVTELSMYKLIGAVLFIDLVVVIVWTAVHPLSYERSVIGTDVDTEIGLVTVSTLGQCSQRTSSAWVFLGPLITIHLSLIIGSNYLLWKSRAIQERYQEQKFVAIASVYVFEILAIGLPVMAAVRDSVTARFLVMSAVIFLNDFGILCFIFIPKVLFVRKGLPDGISVPESILRASMTKALKRSMSFEPKINVESAMSGGGNIETIACSNSAL